MFGRLNKDICGINLENKHININKIATYTSWMIIYIFFVASKLQICQSAEICIGFLTSMTLYQQHNMTFEHVNFHFLK